MKKSMVLLILAALFLEAFFVSAQNETIKCYSSKDCPIAPQYWCDGVSACQKLAQCLNPGQSNSECSVADECVNCINIGYLSCKDGQCQKVKCYKDSECGESFTKKYCSGSQACVYESSYFCENPGTIDSFCNVKKTPASCIPCNYDCSGGACQQTAQPVPTTPATPVTPATCSDSDGSDIFTQGKTCTETNCEIDRCVGNSITVMEYLCENNQRTIQDYGCSNGCKDGACIKIISSEPKCSDTDSGIDYYTKGSVMFGEKISAIDSCEDDGMTLREESCVPNPGPNEGTMLTNKYKCPNGCKDGACVKGEKQKEEVKCVFKNTNTEQKCYRAEYNWMYCSSYQGSCIVTNLEGYDGEKITWKSSCGGYAYTILDGNNEQIVFDCSGVTGNFCQSALCEDGSQTQCYVDGKGYCVCSTCPAIVIKPVCGNGVCESGEWQVCEVTAKICEAGKECKVSPAKCSYGCEQDCKGIEGIERRLDEKFKLQVSQTVKIADYKGIKIVFRDLITPKCEAAATNSAEVKEKLTGMAIAEETTNRESGGAGISIITCPNVGPMAQLEVINPEEMGNKILTLKTGEAKNIYDVSVSFLEYDYASRTGVFVVNSKLMACPKNCKCDSEGYALECRPEEQCEKGKMLCPDGKCKKKCEGISAEKCDYGCLYNTQCLPIGVRVKGLYCGADGALTNQFKAEEACDNNFECETNVCIDGKCISSGVIQKVINWIKRLFGTS